MSNISEKENHSPVVSYEGIEIGAVSVKWVRRNHNGDTTAEYINHGGNPEKTLGRIMDAYRFDHLSKTVACGQAANVLLDLPYRSVSECLEKALSSLNVSPDILLSLGGETFRVFTMKNSIIKNVISSSKCAAGTGEFIVQQFQRMGMTLEEGLERCKEGHLVRLATRCSVHCKSDSTHKLNKGECTRYDIARSLIHDLARRVSEMVESAQWPLKKIVVAGGVALNKHFIDVLAGFFPDSEILVLPESAYLEAYGASLFAQELAEEEALVLSQKNFKKTKPEFERLMPLTNAESLLDFRVQNNREDRSVRENGRYILGVDAGSTTTKAVLINIENDSVDADCYLRTLGNPVQATQNCLNELIKQVGNKSIHVIQAAVTGSGRDMVSVYMDNCMSFNEILTHARAAAAEVPEVGTVFEIGGQDSKFISFLGGIPIDYAMNEGCSAGTGSFLEESASVDMGISMKEISQIAEASRGPVAFGERCAAFINTDLRNALQQGINQEDVVGGLVYSIADNYISRILGSRHIRDSLLFQGGVALNKSVALALATRTQRKIVVPPYPELMGCVGAGLMTKDRLEDGRSAEKIYHLKELAVGDMAVKGTFNCKACENFCEIKKISIRGKTLPFGGLCSKYEMARRNKSPEKGRDLLKARNKLMFDDFKPKPVLNPIGKIGLPMALSTYELYPFYAKLIAGLGYETVLSKPRKDMNIRTGASICYPCQIVHTAVSDLLDKGVDFIFLPRLMELELAENSLHSYTCPSTTVIPDIINAAFNGAESKIFSPHIGLSSDLIYATLLEIEKLAPMLGLEENLVRKAAEDALAYYEQFKREYRELSKKELESICGQPAVVVAGRSYTLYPSEINLSLPQKIITRGYHVIPADMISALNFSSHKRDVWHFTQQISSAIEYSKKNTNMYMCLVSCFSCGPDSVAYHLFRQELKGLPFCYLEIDSHTAHAGFDTRVGAFLDIIEERHRNVEDKKSVISESAGSMPAQNNQPDRNNHFSSARISDDGSYIIDSDGNRVDFSDPRVVFINSRPKNRFESQILKAIYEKRGRKFRTFGRPDINTLQLSKKVCSGRECIPMISYAGAVINDIENRKTDDEITVYLFLDQEGPCQNGAWPMVTEIFTRRLKAKNVICCIERTQKNNYLGFSFDEVVEELKCMLLGDLFEEAENTLKCIAGDESAALKLFYEASDRFAESLKNNQSGIEAALDVWAKDVAEIKVETSVEKMPKVLIFGGLNVAYVHYPITRYFIEQGIIPKVVDTAEGTSWILAEDVIRTMFKHGVVDPEKQFFGSPKLKDRNDNLKIRMARLGVNMVNDTQNKLHDIMNQSGLLFDKPIPLTEILEAGRKYISHNGFNETSVTTGRFLCSVKEDIYDGLINLGCFNCQPAMNSQAIIRPLANEGNIPYIAIDCEGPWISANQKELLETIAMQAKRVREEKTAKESKINNLHIHQ
ncbi:MAG: acyl-CoA dehydratase activase [Dissulfuribacterales bacterium]